MLDWAHRVPWIKKALLAIFQEALFVVKHPYGIVLRMDGQGEVIQSFHDAGGQLIPDVSFVAPLERGGEKFLLLGGLERAFLCLYHLPKDL